jgi:hypothetical protein
MTTVHHAGLGESLSKPTAFWIGLELRVAGGFVVVAGCSLGVEMVSASKIEDAIFRANRIEEIVSGDGRFGVVARAGRLLSIFPKLWGGDD